MSDDQLKEAKVKILHIPTVLGAVVPAYNVSGVSGELRFSPDTIAKICLGTITNWNDKAIATDNPGVTLPDRPIVLVHRSDGSGTNYIFTDYLSKISPEWKEKVGKGTSVKWPVGLGAKGNEGVAGMIRQMDGAFGYVELIYAVQNKIQYAAIRNAAGTWLKGSLEGATAAAGSVKNMPPDFRVSITNAPGKDAYPISSFTWLLIPVQSKDPAKGKILVDFLHWMLSDGETMTSQLDYAPLPENVAAKVAETIKQVH
jgi:phosphate transport system substrate-binding protein